MLRILSPFGETAFLLMRIFFGLLFAAHGAQKLFGMFGSRGPVPLVSLMGLAGIIEFFGGLAIAVGLFAQLVAFVAAAEMVAAYFIAHWPRGPWPIQNQGELAALYFFAFLYISTRGAGRVSVDDKIFESKTD
ncbi:MAG: DoxX family protein [Acidobacteria bacterium]|nr:DoxX family protein [Acidobacteriota bacterium]